jgi:hypothetical protein
VHLLLLLLALLAGLQWPQLLLLALQPLLTRHTPLVLLSPLLLLLLLLA